MALSSPDFARLNTLVDSCKGVTAIARAMSDAQLTLLTHELCRVASRVVTRYAVMSGLNPSEVDTRLRLRGFQEEQWTSKDGART